LPEESTARPVTVSAVPWVRVETFDAPAEGALRRLTPSGVLTQAGPFAGGELGVGCVRGRGDGGLAPQGVGDGVADAAEPPGAVAAGGVLWASLPART